MHVCVSFKNFKMLIYIYIIATQTNDFHPIKTKDFFCMHLSMIRLRNIENSQFTFSYIITSSVHLKKTLHCNCNNTYVAVKT